ncbi:MAG: hypothetical protein Fur005_42770 [Roseiflexaceae bacterium]
MYRWPQHGIAVILLGLALANCSSAPAADIVIGAQGCDRNRLTLVSTREPNLLVENSTTQAMVVSLPDLNNSVTVPPGQRANLAIQPFFWGQAEYYCLTETDHTAAGGNMANGLVCGLDSYSIRPLALSSGTLTVEQHDRAEQFATQ